MNVYSFIFQALSGNVMTKIIILSCHVWLLLLCKCKFMQLCLADNAMTLDKW